MELDSTWLTNHEMSKKEYNSFLMDTVSKAHIYFLYINKENELLHKKKLHLTLLNNKITKEELLYILKKNSYHHDVKFYPTSILQYNICLTNEDIIDHNTNPNNFNFLKPISYVNDIIWNPSLQLFHPLNSVYILLKARSSRNKRQTKKIFITKKKNKRTRRKYHKSI